MKNTVEAAKPSPPSPIRDMHSRVLRAPRLNAPAKLALYLAVALSLMAGVIHLWVMPEHFEEWWGYGTFFLVTALVQGLYGVFLLRWPGKLLLYVGIGGNLSIVGFYVMTRTVGVPLGPHAGHTEAVGVLDLICTASEVALAMTLVVSVQNLHGIKLVLPAILVLVATLGIGGAFLSAAVIAGEPAGGLANEPGSSFSIAQDIPTSFGVVAVEHAEKIPGLTAKQLGGMTHGIQSNVPPDKVRVEASVALTNLLDRPVDYSPQQFSLISEKSRKPIPLAHSTAEAGTLQPEASIEATVSFIAPRDGSRLWIEYQDPGSAEPILVDIGSTDKTPKDAFDGYHGGGERHEH